MTKAKRSGAHGRNKTAPGLLGGFASRGKGQAVTSGKGTAARGKAAESAGPGNRSVAEAVASLPYRQPGEDAQRQLVTRYTRKQLLSRRQGRVVLEENVRRMMAVFDDGVVVTSDPSNEDVALVKQRLFREGPVRPTEEIVVTRSTINLIYEQLDVQERDQGTGLVRTDTESRERGQYYEWMVSLFSKVVQMGASDIHIECKWNEDLSIFRVRVNSVLHDWFQENALNGRRLFASIFNNASTSDTEEKWFEPQDARLTKDRVPELPGGLQTVRLAFAPTKNSGRELVMRLLMRQEITEDSNVGALGYASDHVEALTRMRRQPHGINIISGPTGSGKSTTLQNALAMLIREKRRHVKVRTVEDPAEYDIEGATQTEINNADTAEKRAEKFRALITNTLRSDPDYIMIGELRDRASINLAFQAARTGHGVWTSLHANDALSIIDRLYDEGADIANITDPSLVTGLIAQRLLRVLCPHCRIPYAVAQDAGRVRTDMDHALRMLIGDAGVAQLSMPSETGCLHCRQGIRGRTVAAEVIEPDERLMEHMRRRDKIAARRCWRDDLNGRSMLEHGLAKMVAGDVSPEDIENSFGDFSGFREINVGRIFAEADDLGGEKQAAGSLGVFRETPKLLSDTAGEDTSATTTVVRSTA